MRSQLLKTLDTQIVEAALEVDKDLDYWTREATGQDTEEAEYSGWLIGYLDGLKAARELVEKET